MVSNIAVQGQTYKVIKVWENDRGEWVEYRDPQMKKTWLTILGITRKTRVMNNGWERYDKESIILWNPLSWVLIIMAFFLGFMEGGIRGIKDGGNPFKPVMDNSRWFRKEDVRVW